MKDDSIVIKFFIIIIIVVFFCLLTIELFRLGLQNIEKNNSLLMTAFTSLSFLGVIFTIIVQNKNSKIQRFEDTFFNMLKMQDNIVSNLSIRVFFDTINYSTLTSKQIYRDIISRQVFEEIFKELKVDIGEKNKNDLKHINIEDISKQNYELIENKQLQNVSLSKKICDSISNSYWNTKNVQLLSHYFTFMYRIIKFVDENNDIGKKEKTEYIDILRATLSNYELLVLFYNAIDQNKMRDFIIRYELFNNINYELLKDNTIYLYKLYISKNKNGEIVSAYGKENLEELEKKYK